MTVTVTPILRGSCKGASASPVLFQYPDTSIEKLPLQRQCSASTADSDLEDKLDCMLAQLTPKELETAARSDYDYLRNPEVEPPQDAARAMALRYLNSKKDPELALQKMKKTIAFRQKIDLDGLRLA